MKSPRRKQGGAGGKSSRTRWTQISTVFLVGVLGTLGLLASLHFHVTTVPGHHHDPQGQDHASHFVSDPGRRVQVQAATATATQHPALQTGLRQRPRGSQWTSSEGVAPVNLHPVHPTIAGAWKDDRPKHKGPHRIYCMVPFVWPHPKHSKNAEKVLGTGGVKHGAMGSARYTEIMDTWGKRCDMIEFFIDRPPGTDLIPDLPDNVISINMTRFLSKDFDPENIAPKASLPYFRYGKHIWEKVWRSWIWVREHRAQQFDWFVKVDDDSFLYVSPQT
jgi:hypothetical protein